MSTRLLSRYKPGWCEEGLGGSQKGFEWWVELQGQKPVIHCPFLTTAQETRAFLSRHPSFPLHKGPRSTRPAAGTGLDRSEASAGYALALV